LPIGVGLLSRAFANADGTLHRNILDFIARLFEYLLALHRRGRVVKVHDGVFCTLEGFEAACDQWFACLCQYLDGDVVRHQVLFDQLAHKVEVWLRCGGKANLDLLEADIDQQLEHRHFLARVHRLDQRLVTVAQIDATPLGCRFDDPVRPAPCALGNRWEGAIFPVVVR